jgi:hypothetical protein
MNDNNDKDSHVEEFLLRQYDYITQLFIDNEQIGERRFQFFVSLAGVIFGIIGLFGISELDFDFSFTSEEGKQKVMVLITVSIIVMIIVILFGIMTLKRLIHRNIITDRYKFDLEYIGEFFKRNESKELKKYYPFQKYEIDGNNNYHESKWQHIFSTKNGGLVETVALINSIIGGAIGGIFAFFVILLKMLHPYKINISDIGYISFIFILYFLTIWILQFYYIKIRYDNESFKRCKRKEQRDKW